MLRSYLDRVYNGCLTLLDKLFLLFNISCSHDLLKSGVLLPVDENIQVGVCLTVLLVSFGTKRNGKHSVLDSPCLIPKPGTTESMSTSPISEGRSRFANNVRIGIAVMYRLARNARALGGRGQFLGAYFQTKRCVLLRYAGET